MRTFFIVIFIVIAVSSGIAYAHGKQIAKEAVRYGALVRPFALETATTVASYKPKPAIQAQMDALKTMGATSVRFGLESNLDTMDTLVDEAQQRGLESVVVLEDIHFYGINYSDDRPDWYDMGRKLGEMAGTRWHGKVAYYQLGNEVTGSAFHLPADAGPTIPAAYGLSYDRAKYEHVRDYAKGISDGLTATDPAAKKMITGHWVLVDIVDKLIADGVKFDAVGWDWYSELGDNPEHKMIDNYGELNLPEYMTKLGKEFWFAEVNTNGGSFDGEQQQADWFRSFNANIAHDPNVHGVLVHMLVDMAGEVQQKKTTGSLGLISDRFLADGSAMIGNPKSAYYQFKSLLLSHPFPNAQTSWFDQRSYELYRSFSR